MENKKTAIYNALGFPIVIINPVYRVFEGEDVLDVNPKEIMDAAFDLIPTKKGRLTGAEVRFLRSFMELSQLSFAKLIGVDHSSIAKWEARKQQVTGMEVQTELLLRARCKLFENKKAHIGSSFIDNMLNELSNSEDPGQPIEIAI